MSLFRDIKICRQTRNGTLDVKFDGRFYHWDERRDRGWQRYSSARARLYREHNYIYRILEKLNAI